MLDDLVFAFALLAALVILVRHVPAFRVAAFRLLWEAYLLPLRMRRLFKGE